ncbi:MAG: GTPase domain-containing protein [Planctomycetes bacterium]|nr:GTPase domain-containing protein [Planctomycetota bacterium]
MSLDDPSSAPRKPQGADEFELSIDATNDLGIDGETHIGSSENAAATPPPIRGSAEEPVRDRIVVLGRTRAGKTIYLSRLYEQSWRGNGPLHMETSSGKTHLALLNAVAEMGEQRHWPAATEGSTYLDFEITWQYHTFTMVSLDYPGEVFRRAFVEQVEDANTAELIDHVQRAAGIVLLIDPKVLASGKIGESTDDDYGMVQALRFIRGLPGGTTVPICLVLTKIDVNADLIRHHGGLRGFATKYCNNLLRIVPTLTLFGICAVRSRRDALGKDIPDLTRPARGLENPIVFCLRRIVAERARRRTESTRRARQEFVQREIKQDLEAQQKDTHFWLWANVVLFACLTAVGVLTWLVVRQFL